MPSRLILDKPPNPNDTIYKNSQKWQQDAYDWMNKTVGKLEADSRARLTPVGQFQATNISTSTTADGNNSIVFSLPHTSQTVVTLPARVVSTSNPVAVNAPVTVSNLSVAQTTATTITPVFGSTSVQSLSFTAANAGVVMAIGSVNAAADQPAGILNQVVIVNAGGTIGSSQDQTVNSMCNPTTANVPAGATITITQRVTPAGAGSFAAMSQWLSYIFAANGYTGTATATVTATATTTSTGTGTFTGTGTATGTVSNAADSNVVATLVQNLVNSGVVSPLVSRTS